MPSTAVDRVDSPAGPVAPADALAHLWSVLGQPADALSRVTLTGADPALPSSFAVGTLAQSTIAAAISDSGIATRLISAVRQS